MADGSIAYVAQPGNPPTYEDGYVMAYDVRTHTILDTDFDTAGVQNIDVGAAPKWIAVNPATGQLAVINQGGGAPCR